MKVKNFINGLPHKIQDDHDVWCVIALAKKMTQSTPHFMTISHKERKITFQKKGSKEQ